MADTQTVRCCPDPGLDAEVDYAAVCGCARIFLERAGIIPVLRRPRPRISPQQHTYHSLPLFGPLPLAEHVAYLNGEPPPDRGVTQEWPPFELRESDV
jgi:hypothetical protein